MHGFPCTPLCRAGCCDKKRMHGIQSVCHFLTRVRSSYHIKLQSHACFKGKQRNSWCNRLRKTRPHFAKPLSHTSPYYKLLLLSIVSLEEVPIGHSSFLVVFRFLIQSPAFTVFSLNPETSSHDTRVHANNVL